MYLEKFETTMARLEIEEKKLVMVSPSHLGGKWDVYTESEESNTTKSDEPGAINKEMVTNNHYKEPM
jgi:hypothetical protein